MTAEVRLCRDDGTVLRIDRLLNVQFGGGGTRFDHEHEIIEGDRACFGYDLILNTRNVMARKEP